MEKFDWTSDKKLKHPFAVPDNYFDGLPLQVQKRIQSQKRPQWTWHGSWAVRLAVPAVLLGIGLIWWQYDASPIQESPIASQATAALLQDVSADEMQEYLLHEAEVSEQDIADVASVKGISIDVNEVEAETDDEEILEYIDVEDIESIM